MIQEFKDFIMKGNVLDLAVAVIIAAAFGAIVSAFTDGVLMPIIGFFAGGMDFSDMMIVLQEEVKNAAGEITSPLVGVKYGLVIQKFIDFLIVAFVLFMIIRGYNKANPPAPEPEPGPSQEDLLTEIRDLLSSRA